MAMEFLYCRHIEKMKLTKLTKLSIVYRADGVDGPQEMERN